MDAEQLADRKPRQLSGGQAQRVAIARALAAEPDVLLLDEPLNGLDVAAAAAIRAVLRTVVARTGCAVILITHDLLDVFTLADRVLVLESGKVAETGPVADVLDRAAQSFRRPHRRHQPGQRDHRPRRRAARPAPAFAGTGTPAGGLVARAERRRGVRARRRWPSIGNGRTAARATPSR